MKFVLESCVQRYTKYKQCTITISPLSRPLFLPLPSFSSFTELSFIVHEQLYYNFTNLKTTYIEILDVKGRGERRGEERRGEERGEGRGERRQRREGRVEKRGKEDKVRGRQEREKREDRGKRSVLPNRV